METPNLRHVRTAYSSIELGQRADAHNAAYRSAEPDGQSLPTPVRNPLAAGLLSTKNHRFPESVGDRSFALDRS